MRPARRAGACDRVRVRGDGGGGGREERRQAPEDSAEKHGSCVRACVLLVQRASITVGSIRGEELEHLMDAHWAWKRSTAPVSIINTFRTCHLPTSGYERKLCGAQGPGQCLPSKPNFVPLRVVHWWDLDSNVFPPLSADLG